MRLKCSSNLQELTVSILVPGRKKIAPKQTKQNVARTRKIKYFSLGLKLAALLGPIKLDMRPMPPRELGGILYVLFT